MTTSTEKRSKLAAALAYATRGWRVAPAWWITPSKVCACPNHERCKSPGKHPITLRGLHEATTDEDQIRTWWRQRPHANVLVATGAVSGFDVLDVDPRHGGDETLSGLEAQHGALPLTAEALTGGGGRHVLFAHAEGVTNSRGALPDGLDVRGDGGYILVEPSNHISGGTYFWNVDNDPEDVGLAPWPQYLLALVQAAPPGGNGHAPADGAPTRSGPIIEGQRNTYLTSLAGSMRRRGMDVDEVMDALRSVNTRRCQPPMDEDELAHVVRSVGRYSPAPAPVFGAAFRLADGSQREEKVLQAPGEAPDLTDVGNRDRLVYRYGQDLRYCEPAGGWLLWDGVCWQLDLTRQVTELAIETMDAMLQQEQGVHLGPPRSKGEPEDLLPKWHKASRGRQRLESMVVLAASCSPIPAHVDSLDQRPWLLVVENGTVDLRTGQRRDSRREDLQTQRAPVEHQVGATCPAWLDFLEKVFAGDGELIAFIQEFSGYCLTGDTSEQILLILHGQGSNGKSMFLDVLHDILGPYAQTAPASAFTAKPYNDNIRNDLAALRGARIVSVTETNAGQYLDESLIKRVTGGDRVTARFLHREYFTYLPQFKLFMATNHKPEISGADLGTWRRLRMVPFGVQFGQPGHPQAVPRATLRAALAAERPGILNWMITGCLRWQRSGLSIPECVRVATAEYRAEQDVAGDFLAEYCAREEGERAAKSELYTLFVAWCEDGSLEVLSPKAFSQRLYQRGLREMRSHGGVRNWEGIRIKPEGRFRLNRSVQRRGEDQ